MRRSNSVTRSGLRTVALTAVLAATTLVASTLAVGISAAEAKPSIRVTASSAEVGSAPAQLLRPTTSRATAWRSTRTVGATLTTRFAKPTRIDGTQIRAAARSLKIGDARLEFSDGSALAFHTDSRGDRTLAFTPRIIRWARLVVVSVGARQKSVALAGWTLRRGHTAGVGTSASSVAAVTTSASSGRPAGKGWIATKAGSGQWLQLHWKRPVEVSAIRIAGGAPSASTTIRTGSLRFSDGSTVLIRSLEKRGGAPTTVAFTPRVVTSVRFVATSVMGGSRAAIDSIRAYPVGVVPSEPTVAARTYKQGWAEASLCTDVRATAPAANLRLLCPTNGSKTGTSLRLVVAGPAGAAITVQAWKPRGTGGSIATVASTKVAASGTGRITVPTRRLLHGPAAVKVTAAGVATPLYVQFVNASGTAQKTAASPATRGMDLKFEDDFSRPLSATRTGAGAIYASGKPNYYGVDDFGQAIFAQPDGTGATESTMTGGYLRIPARALPKGASDPSGYGRTSSGGLLSSAHMGGSGFSAQYGYFEARMLGPAGTGTWPAFWLLSSGSLVGGGSTAEVDATELYGNDPHTAFQTSHSWTDGSSTGSSVASAIPGNGDWALSWHTYGARVSPTGVDYYIDGIKTGHTSPVVHDDEPFFFLVNLALTGNWKAGLASTDFRSCLYVDSIRVWV